eukprot:Skav235519  [mRNA]  locus=scaffold625:938984:947480:- [translate_table: standard]
MTSSQCPWLPLAAGRVTGKLPRAGKSSRHLGRTEKDEETLGPEDVLQEEAEEQPEEPSRPKLLVSSLQDLQEDFPEEFPDEDLAEAGEAETAEAGPRWMPRRLPSRCAPFFASKDELWKRSEAFLQENRSGIAEDVADPEGEDPFEELDEQFPDMEEEPFQEEDLQEEDQAEVQDEDVNGDDLDAGDDAEHQDLQEGDPEETPLEPVESTEAAA